MARKFPGAEILLKCLTGTILRKPLKVVLQLSGMSIGKTANVGLISVNIPNQVALGEHTTVDDFVAFTYSGETSSEAAITIGKTCFIGRGTIFNCYKGIRLGDNVMIAAGCQLIDHDHNFDRVDSPMASQGARGGEIVLGNDVWLGAGVIVLKGVKIGDGAIVGAGAVVNKDVGAFEIWGGVPARFLRARALRTENPRAEDRPRQED